MARAIGSYPAGHKFKSYRRYQTWPHRQAVKTSPFHGEVSSSNLLGVTIRISTKMVEIFSFPPKQIVRTSDARMKSGSANECSLLCRKKFALTKLLWGHHTKIIWTISVQIFLFFYFLIFHFSLFFLFRLFLKQEIKKERSLCFFIVTPFGATRIYFVKWILINKMWNIIISNGIKIINYFLTLCFWFLLITFTFLEFFNNSFFKFWNIFK